MRTYPGIYAPWALPAPFPCWDEVDPCCSAVAVGPCDHVLSLQMLPVVGSPMSGSVTMAGVFLVAGVVMVLLTVWMALMSRIVVCTLAGGSLVGAAGDAGQAGECCAVSPVCGTKKVQCAGTHHCIPHWELCDQHQDCEDGWDEEGCPQQPCLLGQWQCRNRVCIMAEWKCNGIDDCGDSSDEDICGKQEHWMLLSRVSPVWAMCKLRENFVFLDSNFPWDGGKLPRKLLMLCRASP